MGRPQQLPLRVFPEVRRWQRKSISQFTTIGGCCMPTLLCIPPNSDMASEWGRSVEVGLASNRKWVQPVETDLQPA